MTRLELNQLMKMLRQTPAMQSKINIGHAIQVNAAQAKNLQDFYALPGDDTAAIPTDQGYLLHACEGMIPSFVEQYPYFAGWSAVMANVSDIAAMGGRATSIVNSFWHTHADKAHELIRGMQDACRHYAVNFAGGHTHIDPSFQPALSVAIQGQAKKLLSVMHVQPQQNILLVLNMNGTFHPNTTYWKCFEDVSAEILQAQLALLPQVVEQGLAMAARDISNAGILGSLLMLLEATGTGAMLQLGNIPKPSEVSWAHWLQLFPSYGFLLTADAEHCDAMRTLFADQDLHCVVIGQVNATGSVQVSYQDTSAEFWDFKTEAFTGLCYAKDLQRIRQHCYETRQTEPCVCQA